MMAPEIQDYATAHILYIFLKITNLKKILLFQHGINLILRLIYGAHVLSF